MQCGVPPTSTGEIGRGFGFGPGRTSAAPRLHAGVDFVARRGDAIRSVWSGSCVLVASDDVRRGPLDGYGNACVVYSPDLGVYWLYAHQQTRPHVSVGQRVVPGQQIGVVGASNNGKFPGMGAHLHLEASRVPWPKGYGAGSIDPVEVFERLGLVVEREPRRRPRLTQRGGCNPLPGFSALRGAYGLGDGPEEAEYEPPAEAWTPDYQPSDLADAGSFLLLMGGLVLSALVVGSFIAGRGRLQ